MRHLLFVSVMGVAAGLACLIRPETGYWLIAIGVALLGFFAGFMVPLQSFLIPRIFGEQVVGRVSGLLNVVVLAALLITPPLFGRIFDITGSYALIFTIFTALSAGTLLLVPYIRLHPRASAAPPMKEPLPQPAP